MTVKKFFLQDSLNLCKCAALSALLYAAYGHMLSVLLM